MRRKIVEDLLYPGGEFRLAANAPYGHAGRAGEHHARDREPPLADLAVVSHEELAQLRLRDVNAGQGENTAQLGADLSRQPVEDAARIAVGGSLEHEVRRSAG